MNEYRQQPRRRAWQAMFLLDSNKLTRIQDILTERLTRTVGPPLFKCDVMFKNGTADTFETITDVLALDNTRRNPITSLTVSAQTSPGADSPASCVVEFMGRTKPKGSGAAKDNIALVVDGENQITKSETFAAVEEQIERTLVSPLPLVAVFLGLLAVLLSAPVFIGGLKLGSVSRSGLSSSDFLQLDELASAAKNSDDKLNFLFDVQRREIHSFAELYRPMHMEQLTTFSGILKILVFLGVLGMLLYMVLFCYPMNAFLWGDYGEYYATLKERRRVIRNIIVGAVLIGIVVNLFSADIWQHYHSNQP
jgi:hypothetical protein